MKTVLLAVSFACLFMALGQFNSARQDASQQYHISQTQQACDASRQSGDFTNCYQTEAKYKTEFLCNSTSSYCWAESQQ